MKNKGKTIMEAVNSRDYDAKEIMHADDNFSFQVSQKKLNNFFPVTKCQKSYFEHLGGMEEFP